MIEALIQRVGELEAKLRGLRARPGRDGRDGKQGPPGTPGRDGRDGKDADQAALETFIAGRVDAAAAQIRVPVDGKDGAPGAAGRDGVDGKDGVPGFPGPPGIDGLNGKDGAPGPRGPQGKPGPKGDKPDHRWQGTSLQFEKPSGEWGEAVDLQGPRGAPGAARGAGGDINLGPALTGGGNNYFPGGWT